MYVCDTAVGRVCVISPTSSLSSYLEQNDVICKTFGIHLRGTPPEVVNITQALDKLRGVSSWLNSWERQTRESLGRTGAVQGPQGIASSKSISSVNIITNSLQTLKETVEYVIFRLPGESSTCVPANSCCRASLQQNAFEESNTNCP